MFKFVFCAANGYQKNLTLPFSRTIAGRMLLKKRYRRTFRSPFSLAKSKCKQALSWQEQLNQYRAMTFKQAG
ncbi:hypothetical protein [Rufibacter quisquiliarum]|uniref:Uncharacterized protein n=1 Tax=Rufibacter quisquiliarum TaxID=1549639 RepID=A0A839GY16_9BACT|nr:hypothetical protein [Rufibacter quisquiliarum]MBA9079606.1 hypothetical protein [Rufibacter quisquiliarum]